MLFRSDRTLGRHTVRVAGEVAGIFGETDRAQSYNSRDGLQVRSLGFTGLASVSYDPLHTNVIFRGGYASGDGNPDDGGSHDFSFDRDFDVGMVLFDEVQGAIDAAAYAAEAANREDRERTSANARLSSLTTETAKVARDADSAAAKLAAFRTRRERLSERLHIAEEAYDVARRRADEFEASAKMRSDQLRIVDPGIVPQRPSYPNTGVAMAGASILALVASVGWLTWRRS